MTVKTFQQKTATLIGGQSTYAWSTAANWLGGLPGPGADILINLPGATNPFSYDDYANLALNTVSITGGQLLVAGTLTIASLSLTGVGAIAADTLQGAASANLTIGALTSGGGVVQAYGAGALTTILGATDLGNTYRAADGGMLILTATPNSTSTLALGQKLSATDTGTIALTSPGATVSAALTSVGVGNAIELPGSSVQSVVFGANTLKVKTNLGTTTFTNVSYLADANAPFGYVATKDVATGLEKITFTAGPVSTFVQTVKSPVGAYQAYKWSTAANWSNGVPTAGKSVILNLPADQNPGSYDDIDNLSLNALTLEGGYFAVAGNLTVGKLIFAAGAPIKVATSASLLSGAPSSLTIGTVVGAGGYVQAVGAGALTQVLAATDPGEHYSADSAGTLIVTATPNAASTFDLTQSNFPGDTGTIGFRKPGAVVSAALRNVGVGSSIELPGTFVTGVTFSPTSLKIATSAGSTTFSNVSYGTSAPPPTGFTQSFDRLTGLEKITFIQSPTTTFIRGVSSAITPTASSYLWSNGRNWSTGTPVQGGKVVLTLPTNINPGSYDDIANLYLDNLNLKAGYLAVAGNLEVATLTVGKTLSLIAADSLLSAAPSSLVIDMISGKGAYIGASGAGAFTKVRAPTDPGAYYEVDSGGFLEITATPNALSGFNLSGNSSYSGDTGTIAFAKPGATVTAALNNVGVGDAIELPGNFVFSVDFGDTSLTVTTDLGVTTFANATFLGGARQALGYVSSFDATTGLLKIAFANPATPAAAVAGGPSAGLFGQYMAAGVTHSAAPVATAGATQAYGAALARALVTPGAHWA